MVEISFIVPYATTYGKMKYRMRMAMM